MSNNIYPSMLNEHVIQVLEENLNTKLTSAENAPWSNLVGVEIVNDYMPALLLQKQSNYGLLKIVEKGEYTTPIDLPGWNVREGNSFLVSGKFILTPSGVDSFRAQMIVNGVPMTDPMVQNGSFQQTESNLVNAGFAALLQQHATFINKLTSGLPTGSVSLPHNNGSSIDIISDVTTLTTPILTPWSNSTATVFDDMNAINEEIRAIPSNFNQGVFNNGYTYLSYNVGASLSASTQFTQWLYGMTNNQAVMPLLTANDVFGNSITNNRMRGLFGTITMDSGKTYLDDNKVVQNYIPDDYAFFASGVNPSLPPITVYVMPGIDTSSDTRGLWKTGRGFSYSMVKKIGEMASDEPFVWEVIVHSRIVIQQNYSIAKIKVI